MKEKIHPAYGPAVISCACGNVIETRGTKERIQVEICSSCHPFFTGRQKLVDTAGRIDRFKKKFGGRVALGTQKRTRPQAKAVPVKKSMPKSESPAKLKAGRPAEARGNRIQIPPKSK